MKQFLRYTILILLTFMVGSFAFSQTGFESEDELKKKAAELFEEGKYNEAYPLYSQLLSIYSKDPEYNYKFGTCMLFVEEDKSEPLKYLEYAAARPNVDIEAIFYLGKGYHYNYRFEEARTKYQLFKEETSSKEHTKYEIDQHINMCNNGTKLLKNITDLAVLDKKTLNRADFFRSYDLSSFGGKLVVKPEDFELAADKKKDETTVMYINPEIEKLYFSSYGEKGKEGKDIYYVNKLPDGGWGEPQNIGTTINTSYNEDYPFFNSETSTLYFASKGHNSMGGYDVFKSYFNAGTNTWSTPVNLDFAVNTPDDDYLYITDKTEKTAYFASTRTSAIGEVSVYKVSVDRIPVDFAIVKGTFNSDNTLSAKITVENAKTGNTEGVFNTNDENGGYVITIPNGGSYKFIIETEESEVAYTGNVEIPRLKTSKPLKQEISLVVENGYEKLIIKNLFDEEIEDAGFLLSADLLKRKADLDINSNEPVIEEQKEEVAVIATEETVVSNQDILKEAYTDAQFIETGANEIKEKSDIAYIVSREKNKQALEKLLEATDFEALANETTSDLEKEEFLNKAKGLTLDAKHLADEAGVAYDLAQKLEVEYVAKKKTSDEALEYAIQMDEALTSESQDDFHANLNYISKLLEDKDERSVDEIVTNAAGNFEEQKSLSDKQIQRAIKLKDRYGEMIKEQERIVARIDNTKDKTEKQFLVDEAVEIEEDVLTLKVKSEEAMELAKVMQEKTDFVKENVEVVSNVLAEVQATESSSITQLNDTEKENLQLSMKEVREVVKEIDDSGELIVTAHGGIDTIILEEGEGVESVDVIDEVALANNAEDTETTDEDVKLVGENEELAVEKEGSTDAIVLNEGEDIIEVADAVSSETPDTEPSRPEESLLTEDESAGNELINDDIAAKFNTGFIDEPSSLDDYGTYYEEKSVELESLNKEQEQTASVELYGSWNESLKNDIAAKQLVLTKTEDFAERALIEEDLKSLEADKIEISENLSTSISTYNKANSTAFVLDEIVALYETEAKDDEIADSSTSGIINEDLTVSKPSEESIISDNAALEIESVTSDNIDSESEIDEVKTTSEEFPQEKTTTNSESSNGDFAATFDTEFVANQNLSEDYNNYYESKSNDLTSLSEGEQQAASVELYGSWNQTLASDIKTKQAELVSTEDDIEKALLAEEIKALGIKQLEVSTSFGESISAYNTSNNTEIEADEIAALYVIDSTLEIVAANEIVDSSNEITKESEESAESLGESLDEVGQLETGDFASTFDSDFIEEPLLDEDYNSYYASKAKQISSLSEEQQQAASIELYGSWSESLDRDIVAKQATLKTTEDATENTLLEEDIKTLEAKQLEVSTSFEESITVYNASNNTSIEADEVAALYTADGSEVITSNDEVVEADNNETELIIEDVASTKTKGEELSVAGDFASTFDSDFIEEPSLDEDYNNYYESKSNDLTSLSEEEQQAASVELYGSWNQTLASDIATKQAELVSTEDDIEKKLLAEEIKALVIKQLEVSTSFEESISAYNTSNNTEIEADEIAALYVIDSTLEIVAADEIVDSSNEITKESEDSAESLGESLDEVGQLETGDFASTFDSDFIEEPLLDEDYNSYYASKAKEISSLSEEQQQAASIELYGSWSESLGRDIVSKQATLTTTEDATENALLEEDIKTLEAKQLEVSTSFEESITVYNASNNTSIEADEVAALYIADGSEVIASNDEVVEADNNETELIIEDVAPTKTEDEELSEAGDFAKTFDTGFIEPSDINDDYNSYYATKKAELASLSEEDQQSANVELYGSWNRSLENDITAKQSSLVTIEDDTEKALLEEDIKTLETKQFKVSNNFEESITAYNLSNNTAIEIDEVEALYAFDSTLEPTINEVNEVLTEDSETSAENNDIDNEIANVTKEAGDAADETLIDEEAKITEANNEIALQNESTNTDEETITNETVESEGNSLEVGTEELASNEVLDNTDEYFSSEIAKLDALEDPIEQEGFKSEVYGNWIDQLNKVLNETNSALETSTGQEREVLLANKSQLENDIVDKTTKKELVDQNIAQLTGNEVAEIQDLEESSVDQNINNDSENKNNDLASASEGELNVYQDIDETQLISSTMNAELNSVDSKVDELSLQLKTLEAEFAAENDKELKTFKEAEVINVKAELVMAENEAEFISEKYSAVKNAENFVRENPTNKVSRSDEYFVNAEKLEFEVSELQSKAKILRDSVKVVKKEKDKDALISQAEAIEIQANEMQEESENILAIAEDVKMAEEHTLNLMKDASAPLELAADRDGVSQEEQAVESSSEYVEYSEMIEAANKLKEEANLQQQQADVLEAAVEEAKSQLQDISIELEGTDDSEEVNRLSALTTELENKLNEIMAMLNSLKNATSQMQADVVKKEQEASAYITSLDKETAANVLAYQEKVESQVITETGNDAIAENDNERINTDEESGDVDEASDEATLVEESNPIIENKESSPIVNSSTIVSAPTESDEFLADIDTESMTMESAAKIVEPTKLTKEIFVRESVPGKSPYSVRTPIPIDVSHPDGLVFKVQVGAFRNPIPQDLFKGFAPIIGENTGTGFTRYMAGLFKDIDRVFTARNDIRSIGYDDAFVVAYYNGNRISIAEARALIAGGTIDARLADNNSENSSSQGVSSKTNNSRPSTNGTNKNGLAISNNVNTINGLFYTVQVGVYTKEVPSSQLFNIEPLNKDFMTNGNVRYSSGIYNYIGLANNAKTGIRSTGISDAFVTAYYKGSRISITEAKDITAKNGNSIFATAPTINNTESSFQSGSYTVLIGEFKGEVPINVAGVILGMTSSGIEKETKSNGFTVYTVGDFTNKPQAESLRDEIISKGIKNAKVITIGENDNQQSSLPAEVNEIQENDEDEFFSSDQVNGIEFQVKIGIFGDEVPVEVAGVILKYSTRVKRVKDVVNNNTTYLVTGLNTYEDAIAFKSKVDGEGFVISQLIAFENGIQIEIEEARQKLGE